MNHQQEWIHSVESEIDALLASSEHSEEQKSRIFIAILRAAEQEGDEDQLQELWEKIMGKRNS